MDNIRTRTWRQVSLSNIVHNYNTLKKAANGAKCLAVVKANAYGHGAVKTAAALQANGCDYFAVATADEAIELRINGITSPILILGYVPPEYIPVLMENCVTVSVSSLEAARAYNIAAEGMGEKLKVHLKVDSGMGRLGLRFLEDENSIEDALEILSLENLYAEGIFTHFSVSETDDREYTLSQFRSFTGAISEIEEKTGHKFEIRHCANSGALLNCPEMYLDMVRPGILLYGHAPGDTLGDLDLRPCMELKSRVYSIKNMPCGASVSYGRRYKAESDRKIAVIPVGYADGLHRVLSGKIDILINGKRAKQVGSICMDMCMVDITDHPDVHVGDIATIFGSDGNETVSCEELAEKAGTISYEILCAPSQRIPIFYK